MRLAARAVLVAALATVCSAHVGSPDAWYEGAAGPYPVLVHIEAPGVIPGIAVVNVRADGPGVERVTAFANRFDATGGTPPPDVAERVADQPGWYRTRLWIMTQGSYGVTVEVSGAAGSGSTVVPLGAFPMRRLGFGSALALGLGAAGVFLLTGLVTIIGSAVREGALAPGLEPDPKRRLRARRAMVVGSLVIALVLMGTWHWWQLEDERFERSLFRPLGSSAEVKGSDLVLTIVDTVFVRQQRADSAWSATVVRPSRLTTDHGKIMHRIVVDETGGRVLAHLHPRTADSISFIAALPPLPAGRYHVFGDIVQESGFTQTLVAAVEIPAAPLDSTPRAEPPDPDDAWIVRAASDDLDTSPLADGSTLRWLRGEGPIRAGEEAPLRFAVAPDEDGAPLEPYMEMAGHAMVVRDDGQVFVHLHPGGTISMAAQMRFMGGPTHVAGMGQPAIADTIGFPYAFPTAGRYHIWVQLKRRGRILTGAFDADVQPGAIGTG